jgi:2-methylisocitrate lyase-like PEP mutase family enzyme
MTADLAARANALLAAHHRTSPLVLPNAWDVVSAKAVEAGGFAAVATSSSAVAAALGEKDDDTTDPDLVFDVIARIARAVIAPVSADIQAGYRLPPEEIVDRLLAAGAVGCNLEDTDHHGPGVLVDAGRQADILARVRRAADARGVHLVLNARVDTFIRKVGDADAQLADGTRRALLYLAAGADCVYPIALADPAAISAFVDAVPGPVNIIARRTGPTIPELAALGVRRISLGGGLHQLATAQLQDVVRRLAAGAALGEVWPTTG